MWHRGPYLWLNTRVLVHTFAHLLSLVEVPVICYPLLLCYQGQWTDQKVTHHVTISFCHEHHSPFIAPWSCEVFTFPSVFIGLKTPIHPTGSIISSKETWPRVTLAMASLSDPQCIERCKKNVIHCNMLLPRRGVFKKTTTPRNKHVTYVRIRNAHNMSLKGKASHFLIDTNETMKKENSVMVFFFLNAQQQQYISTHTHTHTHLPMIL